MSDNKENLTGFFLGALQKRDPSATQVIYSGKDVKLYRFDTDKNKWNPTDCEGTLLFYRRSENLQFGLLLLPRESFACWNQKFDLNVELQSRPPFILYRSQDEVEGQKIEGLWFPERDDCEEMHKRIQQTTATPKATVSYAAVVLQGNGDKEPGDGKNKVLKVGNKFEACQYCGKNSHPSEKCYKMFGKAPTWQGKGGEVGPGVVNGKKGQMPQKRPEFNRQASHPVESSPVKDPAILSTSSNPHPQVPQGPINRQVSPLPPLKLTHLLPTAQASQPLSAPIHHSSSSPQIDFQASDHLKQFLRLNKAPLETVVSPTKNALDISGTSVESNSSLLESENGMFARMLTEKLNNIGPAEKMVNGGKPFDFSGRAMEAREKQAQGVAPVALVAPGMYEGNKTDLRPPGDFEGDRRTLLLPAEMEGLSAPKTGNTIRNGLHGGLNPLNKEQLLQAIEWLLRNDRDFVMKIHEAYVRSLMDNLKL